MLLITSNSAKTSQKIRELEKDNMLIDYVTAQLNETKRKIEYTLGIKKTYTLNIDAYKPF